MIYQVPFHRKMVDSEFFANLLAGETAFGQRHSCLTLLFLRGRMQCVSVFLFHAPSVTHT
ncbi:hypothetical protein ECTOBSL9_0242 [Ectothiorhodospira sp. BSL-9]|nr:hypothetical protein ECTOBSL9_0242 [Ectothiorhodospira sp. BSL-9]